MSNKIIYRDFAVGAKEAAAVDMARTDQQLIPHVTGGVTSYQDDYNAPSVLTNEAAPKVYESFEDFGSDLAQPSANFYVSGNIGFISSTLSGGNANFTVPPKLTIAFAAGQYFSGSGITLYFYRHWCSSVRITYTRDGTQLARETYSCGALQFFFPLKVESYNGIVVEFLSTQAPWQFAKVWRVDFGRDIVFERFDRLNVFEEIDPYGMDLPVGTMNAVIHSKEELLFQDGQLLEVYHNDEPLGKFYVDAFTKDTDTKYTVSALDGISKLENIRHMGIDENMIMPGLITNSGAFHLFDPGINWNRYSLWLCSGCIPVSNCRYVTVQVTSILGDIVNAGRDGYIKVRPVTVPQEIPLIKLGRILGDPSYKKKETVTEVEFVHHTFKPPQSGTPDEVFYDDVPNVPQDKPIIVDTYPGVSEVYLSIYDIDQQWVVSYNSVHVALWGNQRITYKGKKVIEQKNIRSIKNPYASSSAKQNVVRFDTNKLLRYTLIGQLGNLFSSTQSAIDIHNRLYNNVIGNKSTVKAKVILRDEQVGDIVSIETKYDGVVTGIIRSMDIDVGYRDLVAEVVIEEWQT